MGRSGTSLISQALHKYGVNMGKKFAPANSGNPKGYYEDLDFVGLNEQMIIGDDYATTVKLLPHLSERLINKKDHKKLWGWKDPRTVLTLDAYYNYLKDPILVSVFRKPEHIANSLVSRDGVSYDKAYELAVEYQKKTLEQLNKRFG